VGEPKGSSSPLRERAAAPTVPSPALVWPGILGV
jgi:hypothetical protein